MMMATNGVLRITALAMLTILVGCAQPRRMGSAVPAMPSNSFEVTGTPQDLAPQIANTLMDLGLQPEGGGNPAVHADGLTGRVRAKNSGGAVVEVHLHRSSETTTIVTVHAVLPSETQRFVIQRIRQAAETEP